MTRPAIHTEVELAALFGAVGEASLRKEVDHLHPVYRRWIEASPFAILATGGPGGLDVSPRGDTAPLVRVVDEHILLLPERRGNNRIDGLKNILTNPQFALIFLVPGVNETVRVNGSATIEAAPDLLASFAVDGAQPKRVLRVRVETVFLQCGRALLRSALWGPIQQTPAARTAGAMLAELTADDIDGQAYDRELPGRQRATLY